MTAVNLNRNLKWLLPILLALAPLAPAHAAETWYKLNKNEANNAFQNQAATVTSLTTGSQTWTTKDFNLFSGAGIVVAGGSVYSVRQEGGMTWGNLADDKITLLAFSAATGGRYWESRPLAVGNAVDYWSSATPTYDPSEDALYFGSGEYVQKINVKTGDVITSVRLTATNTKPGADSYEIINSSPTIGGNLLFIETYGGFFKTGKQLVALNKGNLSVAWSVMDGGVGNGSPCYVTSGTTQRVYTAITRGVACYNATNGALVWKSSTLSTPWTLTYDVAASLTYDSGNLYVTTNDLDTYSGKGQIICVDAATGAWKWTAPKTIGWVSVPPVVMNGKVYVKGGNSTHLWCFDATTGTLVFDKTLGGNSFATCMAATPTKIYMTDGSKLMILDPATGNPLNVLADSYYDGPVALDARGALYAHAGGALRAFGQTVPVTLSAFGAE